MKFAEMSRRHWAGWALAVALVALTAMLDIGLQQSLDSPRAWLTFSLATMAAAAFGGLGAGLLATGLGCLAMIFLNAWLAGQPVEIGGIDWVETAAFLACGAVISALAHALHRARLQLTQYRTLVSTMDEGFCVIEMIYDSAGAPVDYRFVDSNPAFVTHTGLDLSSGKTMREMVPDHDRHWFEIYGMVARTGAPIRFENPATAMQRYYDVFAFRVGGVGSDRVGILFNDISERKRAAHEMIAAASYDALTGLADREMFEKYLAQTLIKAERSRQSAAVLLLSLDRFRSVNATFGNIAGDQLLRAVAHRLSGCVRSRDLVSRFGGDEFAVMVENCQPSQLPELAEAIVRQIELPFPLDAGEARISVSIGIATYPDCGTNVEMLTHMARAALNVAKRDRNKRYRFLRQPADEDRMLA